MILTLRDAAPADIDYILRLEELCMRAYAEALWGGWRPSWKAADFDLQGHQIIEKDGSPAGCIAITAETDHLWIDILYIHPQFQRLGIGTWALRQKTDAAAREGLPTRLSVLTTNPARRFYEREGFRLEAETAERWRMLKSVRP
ncbi:GNAT family N-acetyltransferase [Labrys neptuniae]